MTHHHLHFSPLICNIGRLIGAALLLGLLAACGTDGDAEPARLIANATPMVSTVLASSLPTTSSIGASTPLTAATTCSLTGFQVSVVAEINRRRASAQSCGSRGAFAAAGGLRWSGPLFEVAAAHARDMVVNGYFSHTGANGSSLNDRVNAIGYPWASVAENIAAGQPTVSRVVEAWMGSDRHCANLMNPVMEEFAVACVYNTVNRSNYWVMALAKPR